ncbi:MAG: A/G-specific adenine glycosylase [Bryobacterales bacterium]|nr:A/G-specific adenine glycosylase [Bryobacterales bacterium]
MDSRSFAARLLAWFRQVKRPLPWRETGDPYRILVSEIMLQQTRAQTVIPYYRRFLERFPDAAALAAAPESEVLERWSGLGYYSRARNLQRAARQVVETGRFPADFEGLLALPGVGRYTAAAVASIAFHLPCAAVDGNVLRVLARVTGERGDIGSGRTRARLEEAAAGLLDRRRPGDCNQALMELGATLCLPRRPRCLLCPVSRFCAARASGIEEQLPVKLRKTKTREVELTLALVERRGRVLFWRRDGDRARMAGFWELPSVEQLPAFTALSELGTFRHTITNHRYSVRVLRGTLARAPRGFRWLAPAELARLPLSTTARKALALAGWNLQAG